MDSFRKDLDRLHGYILDLVLTPTDASVISNVRVAELFLIMLLSLLSLIQLIQKSCHL